MRTIPWPSLVLGLALASTPAASATDYWDAASDPDNSSGTDNELLHGTAQQHDLQTNPGPVADQDWYAVVQYPRSSYEAVIDSTSGDLNLGVSGSFVRIDVDGMTVVQTSEEANVGSPLLGYSQALRWQHTGTTVVQNHLRAEGGCFTSCGPEDQYHIRFYETTVAIPRFNNASGQITVLIIQNLTGWDRPIAGTAYFYNAAGTLAGSTTFSLAADAALVLNTATVPGVAGVSGTIKVAHDGGYGNLAMKSVALEPATGFTFDTPGLYKPR